MGSSLGPVLANIIMTELENQIVSKLVSDNTVTTQILLWLYFSLNSFATEPIRICDTLISLTLSLRGKRFHLFIPALLIVFRKKDLKLMLISASILTIFLPFTEFSRLPNLPLLRSNSIFFLFPSKKDQRILNYYWTFERLSHTIILSGFVTQNSDWVFPL